MVAKSTLAILLLATAATPLVRGQTVRGQLTDSITRTPVPAAFLTLVDDTGAERARTMTNGAGEFSLTAPAAGRYRLRSKRIGFRPYVSAALTLRAGETNAFNVAVDPIPVALPEVVVSSDRQCDIESGASVAAVWDEVREALAAVSWTSRVPSYWYQLKDFRRELTATGRRRGAGDSTWIQEGYALNPIRNFATEAELERQGFVVVTDEGVVYRAPDADVLLTGTFVRTHCFDLQQGRGENEGLLGLAFASARDRTVPDITGTLWVDRQSAELKRLEFRFIRLPQEVVAPEAGGTIEFLRLPSGMWVVRDWTLRMPLTRLARQTAAEGTKPEVTGFIETGGSIAMIKTVSGTVVYGSELATPQVAAASPPPMPPPPPVAPDTATPPPPAPRMPPPPPAERRRAPRSQNVLGYDEFEGTSAVDGMALVQQYRPTWLHSRGLISIQDPTAGELQVYVNGILVGDVNRLRDYRVADIDELRFLSSSEAQQRYGPGHAGGIIEILLRMN